MSVLLRRRRWVNDRWREEILVVNSQIRTACLLPAPIGSFLHLRGLPGPSVLLPARARVFFGKGVNWYLRMSPKVSIASISLLRNQRGSEQCIAGVQSRFPVGGSKFCCPTRELREIADQFRPAADVGWGAICHPFHVAARP